MKDTVCQSDEGNDDHQYEIEAFIMIEIGVQHDESGQKRATDDHSPTGFRIHICSLSFNKRFPMGFLEIIDEARFFYEIAIEKKDLHSEKQYSQNDGQQEFF